MTDPTDGTTDASHSITRRRVLAGVAAGATGVGALTHLSGDASAQADVTGEFSATGDEATLSNAPDAITVSATGEYAVETTGTLDQIRVTLQAEARDMMDDLTNTTVFEGTSGSYDLTADLLADHRDLTADDFMPTAEGETRTTDVRLRVVAGAVQNGSLVAEGSAEATVPVTVDHEGVAVSVGGSADVTIEPAD